MLSVYEPKRIYHRNIWHRRGRSPVSPEAQESYLRVSAMTVKGEVHIPEQIDYDLHISYLLMLVAR